MPEGALALKKATPFGVCVATPTGDLHLHTIVCLGRNYAAHAREQGHEVNERPIVFTKLPGTARLHGDDIVVPPASIEPGSGGDQIDYEAELVVIIGKEMRNVSEKDALSHVLGYTCGNDVTARWWQRNGSGGQYVRGKSFDSFCPIGPWVVPASSIPDPQRLRISCRVNGEQRQDSNTSDMVFPVATFISDLSRGTTLYPGTVVMTGTPEGVGAAMKPSRWLKPGDVVEVEVEKIGVLRNAVRAEEEGL